MASNSNVTKIRRGKSILYRARLVFTFDSELGYKPPPKDFYAATAREAIEKRDAYLRTPQPDRLDRETTFAQFLTDRFLPFEEARTLSDGRSYQAYLDRKSRLTNYVTEPVKGLNQIRALFLGTTRLAYLRPRHIESFFEAALKDRVTIGLRRKLKIDISLALKLGKRFIPQRSSDYLADVTIPVAKTTRRSSFDYDDVVKAILDHKKPVEARACVAFELWTQCRPSEMLAIEWADLDLENGSARFDKAVRRTQDGYAVSRDSKTGSEGNRTCALPRELVELLQDLRKHQMRKAASKFVFVSRSGRPMTKNQFRHEWEWMRSALGLPEGPTFYSLKRLGNSYALASGANVSIQAARMGHSSPRMALTAYRDVLRGEHRTVADLFDRSARRIRSGKGPGRSRREGHK